MTFSSYIAMIYKSSALQDILVKLLFIEYRLSQKIPLIWESDEWVQFNKYSGLHQQFRIYYKGGKASQLWVSSSLPRGREGD